MNVYMSVFSSSVSLYLNKEKKSVLIYSPTVQKFEFRQITNCQWKTLKRKKDLLSVD